MRMLMMSLLVGVISFGFTFCSSINIEELEQQAINGDAAAGEKLIAILTSDESSFQRTKAAVAIGNARVKGANTQLLNSLENDDETVRREAIVSLGKVGIPSNLDVILKVWNSEKENRDIKRQALRALGHFKDPRAVDTLIRTLGSDNNEYKTNAIYSLGNTGSPKAVGPILKLLDQDPSSVLCTNALVKLRVKSSYGTIVQILNRKIENYQFDQTFGIFVDFLGREKYSGAQDVLAKAYLFIPDHLNKLKGKIQSAMKSITMTKSYGVVTASELNLRERPNARASKSGSLGAGELSIIVESGKLKHNIDGKHDFWYRVRTEKGIIGWVYGGYLRILDSNKI